jgi:hypothetical protein
VVRAVFPAEGYAALVHSEDSAVADGGASDISAQVLECRGAGAGGLDMAGLDVRGKVVRIRQADYQLVPARQAVMVFLFISLSVSSSLVASVGYPPGVGSTGDLISCFPSLVLSQGTFTHLQRAHARRTPEHAADGASRRS